MSSSRFDAFYHDYLELVEGGTHKDNTDLGGHTWYGVSQKFLNLIGRSGPITKDEAKNIMFTYFWEAGDCELLPDIVAWCHCDALIQHPQKDAVRILQRTIDVKSDGIYGPVTRSMAEKQNGLAFWERYRIYRAKYYRNVIVSHPAQVDKLAGWIERQHELAENLVRQGFFQKDLETLPWYESSTAKISAVSAGGFVGALALLQPEFESFNGLLKNPDTLKATIVAMFTKYIAGKNYA